MYLFITNDRVELRDAAHLWGERTYRTHELLKSDIGDEAAQIAVIGPAGERLVRFASVIVGGRALGPRRLRSGARVKKVQRHCRARQRKLEVDNMEATLQKTAVKSADHARQSLHGPDTAAVRNTGAGECQ